MIFQEKNREYANEVKHANAVNSHWNQLEPIETNWNQLKWIGPIETDWNKLTINPIRPIGTN